MMARAMRPPSALAAGLAMLAMAEWFWPGAAVQDAPVPRLVVAGAAGISDPAAGAESWSDAILARPLFRPDRRPMSAAAPAAAAAMPRLTAIVVTASGARAIFADDGGRALVLAAGGTVDGDKVVTVEADRVELAGASGVQILRPQFTAPGAPGSVTVAPPQPVLLPFGKLPPPTAQQMQIWEHD